MKPIIIDDNVEMVSSPVMADFSVSEKVLHAPHRHSRGPKHVPQPTTNNSTEKGRKRGRSNGHRRSELQEEVRYLLGESLDEMDLDNDEDVSSPSDAAEYASRMLRHDSPMTYDKRPQPPAMHSRNDSRRLPVQKNDGRKRTCCSSVGAMSVSPVLLYGEVQ